RHRVDLDWAAEGIDVRRVAYGALLVLDALVYRKRAGVRRRRSGPFELLDFGNHGVERRLHGFEARRLEVREIALSRGAGDLELAHLGADRIQRGAGVADRSLLALDVSAQRTGRGLRGVHVCPHRVELEHGGIEAGE